MLLKTKLLLSLTSVGVLGGTGAGVYYGVSQDTDTTARDNKKKVVASSKGPLAPAAGAQGSRAGIPVA